MQRIPNIQEFVVDPHPDLVDWVKRELILRDPYVPVRADMTNWNLHEDQHLSTLRHVLEENYADYVIAEAWAATYKRGDYAEGHTHEGWGWSFVWYIQSCGSCSPLIFPDTQHPWLGPLWYHEPWQGTVLVFPSEIVHYVPPHTCQHDRIVISGNLRKK